MCEFRTEGPKAVSKSHSASQGSIRSTSPKAIPALGQWFDIKVTDYYHSK